MRTSKKIFLPVFSVLQFIAVTAHAQWIALNSGDSLPLNSIHFVNDSTGFIAGCDLVACETPSDWSSGSILKTTDAGNTWNFLQNPQGYGRTSVAFVDDNIGYAAGPDIIKTIDGGITWFYPGPNSSLNSPFVYFINDTVGFIDGSPFNPGHTIRKTIDGGISWNASILFSPPSQIAAVFFTSTQVGFAVGHDSALVLKTTDAGFTWIPVSTMYSLLSVYFPSANYGYAVGYNGTIIHTNDAGINWSPQFAGTNANLHSIFCLNDNTCYAVGENGTILQTTDQGNTWVMHNSGTIQDLRSVYCTNYHCYASGDSGVVLKTVDGEVGFIESSQDNLNDIHIFPNPSGSELNIQFNSTQIVQFVLYNSSGEKIIDEMLTGKTGIINLSAYPTGVYFYMVTNENHLTTNGKIIK